MHLLRFWKVEGDVKDIALILASLNVESECIAPSIMSIWILEQVYLNPWASPSCHFWLRKHIGKQKDLRLSRFKSWSKASPHSTSSKSSQHNDGKIQLTNHDLTWKNPSFSPRDYTVPWQNGESGVTHREPLPKNLLGRAGQRGCLYLRSSREWRDI